MDNEFWLSIATVFCLGEWGPNGPVYIQRCQVPSGSFQWEVCSGELNLNRQGEWEVFLLQDSGDALDRRRFESKEQALEAFREWQEVAEAEEREVRRGFLALSEASWARAWKEDK